ncbi:TRAP transporter substrate-binding protein [Sporosarcina sp. FSL W7-1349]|uniref:TRAP transporter substrate-binding protein n=1 Tax=Sporosarcina sp. FSL W7-1349 TaxID=2921561 RepID=UPI0030F6605B
MKLFHKFFATVLLIGVLAGCSQSNAGSDSNSTSGGSASKDTIKMRSADVVDQNSPYTIGMMQLAEDVSNATDGKITIEHFHSGQLGSDAEIFDSVKQGSIDIALQGAIPGSEVAGAFYIPYLFEDADHLKAVIQGEPAEKIKALIEAETGVKVIGFVPFATRMLTTKGVEVNTPEDLKGLKIRVPETPAVVTGWKDLGANPTPISFGELFTSLQTGVVDGQENPYEIIYNNSFYEVQDTINKTYHNFPVRTLIMNKKRYDSLSADEKSLLEEKWAEVSEEIDKLYSEQEAEYITKLEEAGMKFVDSDIESFKKASEETTAKLATEIFGAELYEEMKALGNSK